MPAWPIVALVSASDGDRDSRLAALRFVGVGLAHDFGKPPVEHDDLTVAAQHHVFRFQVAMDDAARMGVADRLTDLRERLEQLPLQLEPVGGPASTATMKFGDGVAKRLPAQEAHGVERLVVFLASCQLVDRNDVGMLELAGDLRFLQEPVR